MGMAKEADLDSRETNFQYPDGNCGGILRQIESFSSPFLSGNQKDFIS